MQCSDNLVTPLKEKLHKKYTNCKKYRFFFKHINICLKILHTMYAFPSFHAHDRVPFHA